MPIRAAQLVLVSLALVLGCAAKPSSSRAPTHEELVNLHMQGDYEQVLHWCPIILEDRGAVPALSDWCLFAYPAALRLSLDTTGALTFVSSACVDMTGAPQGDEAFRTFYVREVARWVALPLRLQKHDASVPRATESAVADFARVCQVSPEAVHRGLDTDL